MSAGQTTLEVPPPVLQFLAAQRTLTLATASSAAVPRATTVLYVNEGPTLYFWSRATTLTARQIQQNPIVAFTIDGSNADLNTTQGIQGLAECSVILSGEEIARVAAMFGDKFPDLQPGSTMSISFFRITPTELQFIDNTQTSVSPGGNTFGADFHRERSYSIIEGLPQQLGDTFISTLAPMDADAGETIVREGTPGDKLLLIVEGEADVSRAGLKMETLQAGDLFGEVAIMRDQPRSVTVTAKTPVKLFALDRDRFRDLIASSMEITPDFDTIVRARLGA